MDHISITATGDGTFSVVVGNVEQAAASAEEVLAAVETWLGNLPAPQEG